MIYIVHCLDCTTSKVTICDVWDNCDDAKEALHNSYSDFFENTEYLINHISEKTVHVFKYDGWLTKSKFLHYIYSISEFNDKAIN